ncbi:MAG: hypothetical protein AAB355_00410 [Patescibacteria group bacterium]
MIRARIAADFFIILSIFIFPYWVPLLAGLFFLFYFRNFYEYLAVAFFLDLLYGGGVLRVYGIPFFLSIAALILYISAAVLKKRLILYG